MFFCIDEVSNDCELIRLGSAQLSESTKSDFADFYPSSSSSIQFENSSGVKLDCIVSKKIYKSNNFTSFTYSGSVRRCLDGESASIIMSSDRFSLEVELFLD
jgi:hypothetical protein